jgi:uncharacterized membrane protein YoaK (UPF0700 family)
MSNLINDKNLKEEKLSVGLLLAIIGGFLDSYSYLIRSKVFANAQTGNMVLLGINIINKQYINAFHYLIPILAYFVGIVIAFYIQNKLEKENFNWIQVIIIVEIIILVIVAFIPNGEYNYIANILISFTCALQVQTFKRVHGLAFASTMCTGNLIKLANAFTDYLLTGNKNSMIKFKKYTLIILLFIMGALLGCILTDKFGVSSVLICPIILLLVLKLTYSRFSCYEL